MFRSGAIERARNFRKNLLRGSNVGLSRTVERGGNGAFDRSRHRAQVPRRARFQPQAGAPAVARIALPLQVSSRDEPLQDLFTFVHVGLRACWSEDFDAA